MDYERIEKPFPPQGRGFSPGKLRAMLAGVEKKRKEEEEELEAGFSLRVDPPEIEDRRASAVESCRDVDMVSSHPECSTSMETVSVHRSLAGPRIRLEQDDAFESESGSSGFEFQKADRALHRSALMLPFSKPAPSKWDDAQKWIASPTSHRGGKAGGVQSRKPGLTGYGNRQAATRVVLEVTEEADTKRIDPSQEKKLVREHKSVNWVPEPYLVVDSATKPPLIVDNPLADSEISLSRHDSSTSVHSAATFFTPPSTVRSVSMRDIGTEMTPIASQEPSRTGTPVRATTPIRSPTSSRPSTPQRTAPNANPTESADCHVDSKNTQLSEKELQMKTRREIMVLGQQLGKTNIANWASKEEEETNASVSLKTVSVDQAAKSVIEARATAWEEAEKAKYLARFKREEIKIQAWENHQKAKTEAEMRKIEVEVERMRARAHERLMNKLAAARHKAEEKRAAAEAKRNQQATRTTQQAEYIRKTGRIPSSFACWSWCF
ncbi:uncharacterized protein LOC103697825 [Phoenix dactylifera]|uniref:Uncharacterized protein LOC103697825 n=1 Tax=Phoenix dactylifera TaxID=42345 RepID=A0A8B9A223_PHODC|nr:uncharacterized protein LOC103697825 [Phoenix dactylifera]